MAAKNDRFLTRLFHQLMERTGDFEKSIELLVAKQGIPKWKAEALACGLGLMPKRYLRNQGTLGFDGQKQLLEAKVMVVGLGGLGGYVLEQLARVGTGTLVLVDPDRFEDTNLNRQLLADLGSMGTYKTEAARKRVAVINNAVELYLHTSRAEDLPDRAYHDVDLIFDCLDQIPPRLHLENMGERLRIPIVHGAIGGWYGQVAVVWPGSGLLSTLYGERQEGIEKALGNPPFTPALTAALMVGEGLKVLLGKKPREDGIYYVDLLNNQWEFVSLRF